MPIKAKKLLNPIGSITLTVTTLDDAGNPQEETLTFQHRLVTAGSWVGTQFEKPQQPAEETADDHTDEFLLHINPDDLTEEQLAEVLRRVPLVREVADFLVSWDVIGDDDKPLPPTPRNLLKLDMKLLREMSKGHFLASFPNWTT